MTLPLDVAGATTRSARFSPDRRYRYTLRRQWDAEDALVFVMLNPSDADADRDDPTIKRCGATARRYGYGGILVLNLYAYQSSTPAVLWTVEDPVGPDNDVTLRRHLRVAARYSTPVVCAWGNGARPDRVAAFLALRPPGIDLRCLGTTLDGSPIHPSARGRHRVPADAPLLPWTPAGRATV
jgi:hypothetical protein